MFLLSVLYPDRISPQGRGRRHLWQGEGFVSAEHGDVAGLGDRSVPKGRTDPRVLAALGLLALPWKVGSSSGKQLGGTRREFPPPALQRMAIAALSPPLPRCAGLSFSSSFIQEKGRRKASLVRATRLCADVSPALGIWAELSSQMHCCKSRGTWPRFSYS